MDGSDQGTARLIIGFVGILALGLSGGVVFFACTNAQAIISQNASQSASVQWVLPVLISFASIPLTALVTLATTRTRPTVEEQQAVAAPPDPLAGPPTAPIPTAPIAIADIPLEPTSFAPVVHDDHEPGAVESMTAGVPPVA